MSERNGIITFYSSSHAIHAEKVLKAAGFQVDLIPGPKEISPNCGVALKYDYVFTGLVEEALAHGGISYEACHQYTMKQEKSLLDRLWGR